MDEILNQSTTRVILKRKALECSYFFLKNIYENQRSNYNTR